MSRPRKTTPQMPLAALASPKGAGGRARLAISIEGDEVPTEFRIFRFGLNQSEKGTFLFDQRSADMVMAEYAAHGKPLLMDFNHGTTYSTPTPEMAVSAGEFTPSIKADGLYATAIKWTDRASKMLTAKEYRLFSPYFNHEGTDQEGVRRVTRLINCALTNLPALDHIEPLMAADAKGDDPMECKACDALSKQLSVKDEELTALRAEITSLKGAVTAPAALRASVLKLTGKDSDESALGVLEAHKHSHGEVADLKRKLTEIETAKLSAEFATALDKAVTDGKVAPAQKSFWEGIAKEDGFGKATARLTAFAETATALTVGAGGDGDKRPPAAKLTMGAEQKDMVATLGWTPEKLAAFQKAREGASA